MQCEIRVIPYSEADDIKRLHEEEGWVVITLWVGWPDGDGPEEDDKGNTHVATCPACKRARGLTEMEWIELKDWMRMRRYVKAYSSKLSGQYKHNSLFNLPAEGDVKVIGL